MDIFKILNVLVGSIYGSDQGNAIKNTYVYFTFRSFQLLRLNVAHPVAVAAAEALTDRGG